MCCMNKITLTYKIKDFVKAIKLSFLCFSKRDQIGSLLLSRRKKEKNEICAMICASRFDGQVGESSNKEGKSGCII